MKHLPRGIYTVNVEVKDLQSNGGIQSVKIRICECRNGECLAKEHSVSLGGLGLLAMLLPLVLLLLLCEFPTDTLMTAGLFRQIYIYNGTCLCKSRRRVIEVFFSVRSSNN